jgi:hypothetical protein
VSLTPSVPAPQPAGTTINWSVTASGGAAPYQYKWLVYNGTSWTAMTGWTTSSTWLWKPSSADADYIVRVWVRNVGNVADVPQGSASASFPISKKCTGKSCR